jgi:hypothetical protein
LFQSKPIDAVVYAYGDIGQGGAKNRKWQSVIRQRIAEIQKVLSHFPQLALPDELITQKLRNPMHPKQWNIRKQYEVLKTGISLLLPEKPA